MEKTKFNSLDEALIEADIDTVYDYMMSEFGGGKRWWKHLWEAEPIGKKPISEAGGCINITVHDMIDIRFAARTISIKENDRVDVEFYCGDITGHGTWRWKAEGNKTRVSFDWHASPNSLKMKFVSAFVDIEKIHGEIIRGGFDALNGFLTGARI
ncbi:MAG: hypothetical protein ACU833_07035 [Gammaproteobacteria bacterium]